MDNNPDTAEANGISSVPTFKALQGGKTVREFSGADSEALENLVDFLAQAK